MLGFFLKTIKISALSVVERVLNLFTRWSRRIKCQIKVKVKFPKKIKISNDK